MSVLPLRYGIRASILRGLRLSQAESKELNIKKQVNIKTLSHIWRTILNGAGKL
jgi:hypothetical protein